MTTPADQTAASPPPLQPLAPARDATHRVEQIMGILRWRSQAPDKITRSGAEWSAPCPAHDDAHPSLSITAKDPNTVLVHCHAGCPHADIMAALGLTLKDLFVKERYWGKAVEATYDYVDLAGTLVHQTVRLEGKEFKQRRPDPAAPGKWVWNLKGVQRLLYHWPEVHAAIPRGEPIYLVEGEKDAENLAALGLVATCNAMGAEKWQRSYSEALRNAHVVILPDHDDPGTAHARLVARSLAGMAASIRIVLGVHTAAEHSDVSDWLAAGHTRQELEDLVDETAPETLAAPPPGQHHDAPLAAATASGQASADAE